MSDSAAVVGVLGGAGEQGAGRRELSLGAVVTLFGGLVTTLLGALIGLMMWQFNSLKYERLYQTVKMWAGSGPSASDLLPVSGARFCLRGVTYIENY